MDKEKLESMLECVNMEILVYKNNLLKEIEAETMVVATSDLMIMRDLKEQQLLLKRLIREMEDEEI